MVIGFVSIRIPDSVTGSWNMSKSGGLRQIQARRGPVGRNRGRLF